MFLKFLTVQILIFITHQGVEGVPTFDSGGSARTLLRLAKSSEMRNYLNESVDPCEDFHDFACGNFRKLNPTPPTKPYENSIFQTMKRALEEKITKHLGSHDESDTQLDQTVKAFYRSCVNITSLESSYKAKLKEIVSEFGQMPAMSGDMWTESDFYLSKTLGEIAYKYDIKLLVGCTVTEDNNDNYSIIFVPPLGLANILMYTEKEYHEHRESYQRRIEVNMRIFMGLEKSLAQQTAKEIFDFEKDFAIAAYPKVGNSTANKTAMIDEVHYEFAPELNIIKLVIESYGKVPWAKVNNLIEGDPESIRKVLRNTPKRVVANYVFYNLVENFMLNSPDLPRTCLQKTREYFPNYIDNMIFPKYFNGKTTQDVESLWNFLKSTFENDLNSGKLEWLKGDTRKNALMKLKTIKLEISSSATTNFTEEFGSLNLTNQDYIANLKSIFALRASKSENQINQAYRVLGNIESIQNLPYTIRAENKIIVPVSILQPYYLWSNSYPNALKFSTLGALLSHELIQIFVADGYYRNCWNYDTSNYFNRRSECLKEQHQIINSHNKLYTPQLNSQSECVADTAVISLAYAAYVKWSEDSMNNQGIELMPRLNYTSKQLFFISYGQMLCSDSLEFIDSYFGFTDYVIDKYHINGPLSNYKEFSNEFMCPFASTMNPAEKCGVY